jgi:hypothetical protein
MRPAFPPIALPRGGGGGGEPFGRRFKMPSFGRKPKGTAKNIYADMFSVIRAQLKGNLRPVHRRASPGLFKLAAANLYLNVPLAGTKIKRRPKNGRWKISKFKTPTVAIRHRAK